MAADLRDYWSDELLAGLKRDPADVLRDVQGGALTAEEAKWHCGVVLTGEPGELRVDAGATEELRAQIRVAGAAPGGA
ncbi:MAG: hypothetical protein OXT09_08520 [Myxococcales bacterium]|nr:hypothetical protein [Myxococcales bacterium]